MRYMRDYIFIILCTFLKTILNNIYVNINFDVWSFLYTFVSAAILKSHSFFVPLVYMQGRKNLVNNCEPGHD